MTSIISESTDLTFRVLTMVDDTQNYWVFGLCPSSEILGNRGH
jgi:hypothetical protein